MPKVLAGAFNDPCGIWQVGADPELQAGVVLVPAKAEDVDLADTVSRVGPLDSFLEFDRQIKNHRSNPFEDRNESRRGSLEPAVNGFPGLDLLVFQGSLFLAGPRNPTLIKNRCCR